MKKVLKVNKAEIKKDSIQGVRHETILNDLISKAEEQLKAEFTDEEKVELKNNSGGFLRKWIKQFYQFPNASDEFNNEALGVDLEGLIREFGKKSLEWRKYPYTLENGVFKLDTEAIQKRYTIYTSNEFQNDSLELAQDLIKLVDRGIEKGIINTDPQTSIKIQQAFDRILSLDGYSTSDKFHNLIPSSQIKSIPKLENAYILNERKKV